MTNSVGMPAGVVRPEMTHTHHDDAGLNPYCNGGGVGVIRRLLMMLALYSSHVGQRSQSDERVGHAPRGLAGKSQKGSCLRHG